MKKILTLFLYQYKMIYEDNYNNHYSQYNGKNMSTKIWRRLLMKYYLEYNTIMEIKALDTEKYTIKPIMNGDYYKVYIDKSERTYFIVDKLYDTIEECIKWLGFYSKKVKRNFRIFFVLRNISTAHIECIQFDKNSTSTYNVKY